MSQLKLFPADKSFTRLEAAEICYDYLSSVLAEPEEEEIHKAAILKDLYDCRVCVNKIAQVYLKGIITPGRWNCFEGKAVLSEEELMLIEERLHKPEKRVVPEFEENDGAVKICLSEVKELTDVAIIDVRTQNEYEKKHYKGAVNIPLSKYVLNPVNISASRYSAIVFVCENGAAASIAAECALKSGFKRVFYSSYL